MTSRRSIPPLALAVIVCGIVCAAPDDVHAQSLWKLHVADGAAVENAHLESLVDDTLGYDAGAGRERIALDDLVGMTPGRDITPNAVGGAIGVASGLLIGSAIGLLSNMGSHRNRSTSIPLFAIGGAVAGGTLGLLTTSTEYPDDARLRFDTLDIVERRAVVDRILLDEELRNRER